MKNDFSDRLEQKLKKPKTNYYNCILYLDGIEHIKNDKLEIFMFLFGQQVQINIVIL